MDQDSNFFERLIKFAQSEGIMNANQLSKHLGYGSSEKISRLGRGKNTKPGFDLLFDLANMFENVPLYWLITGKAESSRLYEDHIDSESLQVNDASGAYRKLPPKFSQSAEASNMGQTDHNLNPLFQELLDEKDEVIASLKEVIEAQKDTISLLKQKS